jgi:hypothetical protein
MTDIAIRVENLSKLYHMGRLQQRHATLRDGRRADGHFGAPFDCAQDRHHRDGDGSPRPRGEQDGNEVRSGDWGLVNRSIGS